MHLHMIRVIPTLVFLVLPTVGFAQPVFEQLLPGVWGNGQYGVALDRFDDRLLIGAPGFTDANNLPDYPEEGAVHALIRINNPLDPWTVSPVSGSTTGQIGGERTPLSHLDYLGRAIDLDGDLLGGLTAVIGAPGSDSPHLVQDNTGAAYILADSSGQWRIIHRLDPWGIDNDADGFFEEANVDPTGGQFGHAVSVEGNLIAIGLPYASAAPGNGMELLPEAGAVAIYHRSGSTWTLEAVLSRADTDTCALDIHALDYFGYAVALSGNFLAVGVPLADDPRMSETGACFVGGVCIGDMSEVDCATFGGSWLIGQTCSNDGLVNPSGSSGACCYLDAASCEWQSNDTMDSKQTCVEDYAGVWLLGQTAGAIDCPIIDTTNENIGAVHVFERTISDGWLHRVTLQPFATNTIYDTYRLAESWFGLSVAFENSTIAVGQPGYIRPADAEPEEAGGRGMAWAFERADVADTTWSLVRSLDPNVFVPPFGPIRPAPAGARYGWSVDVSPCHIAVGAPGGDYSMDWEPGGAYVWDHLGPGLWDTSATLDFIDPDSADPGEQWGIDVAIVDEGIAIGGWLDDAAGQWSGAAETWILACDCDPPIGPVDDCDQDGCSDAWQIMLDPSLDLAGTCGDLGTDGMPLPDGVLDLCQMGYHPDAFRLETGRGYEIVSNPGENYAAALSDPMLLVDGVELVSLSTYLEAAEVAIVSEWDIDLDGTLWLGGRQTDTSGDDDAGWTWPFDEFWSWTNWAVGQPDNLAGKEDTLRASGMDLPWEWTDELSTATADGHLLEYASDCNGNLVLDAWDIRAELVYNSVIIDCDMDCRIDSCQIAEGVRLDCNANGVPDRCDVDPVIGSSDDCNGNGIPDECDADPNDGSSEDCNGNGIPDECETPDDLLICDAIVINEVLVDTGGSDVNGDGVIHPGQDQFVEIVNNSDDFIDLQNWEILQDGIRWHIFSEITLIETKCAVLVFGGGKPNPNDFPEGVPIHTASNGAFLPLRVPPSGNTATLMLRDDTLTAHDTITWGNEADTDGPSLTRCPDVIGSDPDGDGLINIIPHDECTNFDRSPGLLVDESEFSCNNDADEDGVLDSDDNCVNIWNPTQDDCDGDGIGDACDTIEDCEPNGIDDCVQIANDISLDCDEDGALDICQIRDDPGAVDCNTTARLDSCELDDGIVPDCNENGRPDSCDIDDGISLDENGDGIPDECCLADIPCDGVNGLLVIINNLDCVGTPPTCPGDFNCSGLVDTGDILDYLSQCSFK